MANETSIADRLGITSGQLVAEVGHKADADAELRAAVAKAAGKDIVTDSEDAADTVLMWYRESDGDLVDILTDAVTSLNRGGQLWLLTPKTGRDGHVEPSDIGEAATTAGLKQASNISASANWVATRLTAK